MYNYIFYLVLLSLYKFYTHRIYLTSFLNFLQKDLTRIFKIMIVDHIFGSITGNPGRLWS